MQWLDENLSEKANWFMTWIGKEWHELTSKPWGCFQLDVFAQLSQENYSALYQQFLEEDAVY
ncbi:hypothetical protein A4G19_08450 [Pasteurellaceae bacterium Macca]|nr:hypothetical protein [Pasteurellaceae bacterium Macca]